ncbi:hypothetical protein E2C01_010223 [Portunus trituberculatus]|uniref:Uncharacterized protein n=1 Tax=Portunus trituberculatus TaxID=210409 RepID=A0A5B7D7V6_PORTR|nr:hypothetical protein [Portunus trituberculatus]
MTGEFSAAVGWGGGPSPPLTPLPEHCCHESLQEADLKALLGGSWPRQSAIYDVSGGDMEVDGAGEDIVIHTELDTLKEAEDEDKDMPDIFFLPVVKGSLISSLSGDIEDDEEVDFEDLEDSVCLEDGIVEVFRDADLYQPAPSPTANPCGGQVTSMREDEYLYLGYKKLCEYPSRKLELSYYRLLQIIHNEHFATLGYPTWKEMLEQQQVVERPTSHHAEPGSDTDTASEGPSEDEENNLDWEEIFETRRFEAMQEMKEREGRKRKEEMRRREEEREKARLEKQKELEREAREKELAEAKQKQAAELIFTPKMKLVGSEEAISKEEVALKRGQTTKKRRGRPPGSLNKPKYGDEDFVILDDADKDWTPGGDKGASTPRRRCKQPTSWEEFDRMFARLTSPATMAELMGGVSDAEQPRTRRRVIHSDRGIVGGRRRGRLKYNPCDQKIKPVDKSNLMSVRAKKLKKMLAKKKKQNLASKSKHMLKDCKIPMKRVKVSRKSPHSEDEAQSKNEPEDSPGLVIKKEDELRFEASKTTEEQDSVKISVSSSSEWPVCGARVGQTGSAEMDLKKHDSGLEMEALAKGRGKHEEENRREGGRKEGRKEGRTDRVTLTDVAQLKGNKVYCYMCHKGSLLHPRRVG